MTFENLAQTLISWGHVIKSSQYESFKEYTTTMLRNRRVIFVNSEDGLEAVIFFFITNDYSKLYKKSRWAIPVEDEGGSQAYIDKMICHRWTHGIRRHIQDFIESNFPNVVEAFYHRAPFDRCVKITRRSVRV